MFDTQMVIKYLVTFYFICAMVYSAPPFSSNPGKTSSPTEMERKPAVNNTFLPTISPPKPSQNSINYETRGGAFEGDIAFPKGVDPIKHRGVALTAEHRWPNNIIPYDISAITSSSDRDMIIDAMNRLMFAVGTPISGTTTSRNSCVYFRPKLASDQNFLNIVYGDGCSATPGLWAGSKMTMTLNNPGCFYSGIIQHELMHALGFYHEQSRPDRDSYITVVLNNIDPKMIHNFDKYSWGKEVLNQKTPYDYGSIMHYPTTAFSRNEKLTIVPKKSGMNLGQRVKLSPIDITEIRSYYKC